MSTPGESNSCTACGSGWRLPLLLGIVLAAMLLVSTKTFRQTVFAPLRQQSIAPEGKVLLTVNFGNGQLLNVTENWRDGMTVADVMQNNPRSNFLTEGSGESAFLTSLNGVMNEGAGGRNWTYTVNGKYADRSFAVYELRPNDHVLWTFAAQK